jgi:hypothetical protein
VVNEVIVLDCGVGEDIVKASVKATINGINKLFSKRI